MVRFKNRYICFEIEFEEALHSRLLSEKQPQPSNALSMYEIEGKIKTTISQNFGDVGYGLILGNMNVKYFSPVTKLGILRVARDHYRMVWMAMTLIRDFNTDSKSNMNAKIRVIHVSGSIRKCQVAAIKHDRNVILRLYAKKDKEISDIETDFKAKELIQQSENTINALDI